MRYILANRLGSDYINSLPVIKFEGKVVVVDSKEQEEEVINRLYKEILIGFDTESKPAFKKGESYPISLLQLATHDIAYLFQLKRTGFTDALAEFLADKNIKKIGVGIENDIAKLKEQKQFKAEGFIDLSVLAAKKGIIQVGLRALTARYIMRRLVKSSQKTNWAQFGLTKKQQVYAASDAWICLLIYPHLLADNIDYRQFNDEENNFLKNEN